MTFNDLHPKNMYRCAESSYRLFRHLLTDKRVQISVIILIISVLLIGLSSILYFFQKNRIDVSVIRLSDQTNEILRRKELNQHKKEIPKFEASMKSIGAYTPPISSDLCRSHIANCFLQKNKPHIGISVRKQTIEPLYTIQSCYVKFQSSFDYEIFDMMEYILSNPSKFGYTRLREFEIEQLFETSPIVKGRFVYDQLSLTP